MNGDLVSFLGQTSDVIHHHAISSGTGTEKVGVNVQHLRSSIGAISTNVFTESTMFFRTTVITMHRDWLQNSSVIVDVENKNGSSLYNNIDFYVAKYTSNY